MGEEEAAALRERVARLSGALAAAQAAAADARAAADGRLRSVAAERDSLAAKLEGSWAAQTAAEARSEQLQEQMELLEVRTVARRERGPPPAAVSCCTFLEG